MSLGSITTENLIQKGGNDTSIEPLLLGHPPFRGDEVENQGTEVVGNTVRRDEENNDERVKGYFCSDVVFNLSSKVLTDMEIKVLGKGLGYVPTPSFINEADLRSDFDEFCRKMRCKWFFRDETTSEFSETPAFRPKSKWKPPAGHPALELFLSNLEKDLFNFLPGKALDYNLSKEEWKAMRGLADDKNIIIKKADKGSCVVVWDRGDYLAEGYKQLQDQKTYSKVKNFGDDKLKDLVSKSDDFFREFYGKRWISEKEMKYFTFEFKKTSCLGKMYLLPKIHKRTFNVPGRPVISNCGTPTEKVSEFLDFHLKPVMMAGKSYVKDTGHFLEKLRSLGRIPQNSILVTADVVGLYPSIPHQGGLKALFEKLEERQDKKIPSNELVKMAEFVLKNNYFEFNSDIYHQMSGTAIGTKFAPPYACLFMDRVETEFLDKEPIKPWVWLRYIDDIFFVWTAGEKHLEHFLERLNSFHTNLKFTHEMSKNSVNFLDLVVSVEGNELVTNLYCKPTDCHQFLEYSSAHPIHIKRSIVYSQGLRIKRLCTKESDFQKHAREMKN